MSDVPTGTVTLLFTDVEGSTRLLKQLRSRYGELLAQHHRLMRDALGQHSGREMDTQGEAFFAVFPRAKDAVAAAIAAQRAHFGQEWPDGVDVGVRMGLHTAEPEVAGDRYVGLGVHRAARLCAVGHGGQVLLSRSTAGLVDEDETPGISLRDLGEHLLKDLERPERIYQLVVEGLPDQFPPLQTVTEVTRRRDIPSGMVTFVATDMVGFGKLIRKGTAIWAPVLDEHDRLLRREFARKGHVVDVVGDSFVVAFAKPLDAVLAAAAAREALEKGEWGEGRRPEVQIGIHTGAAVRTEERYVSSALVRALQVCAEAEPGQLIISQSTESLLETDDLGELSVREIGERELRDFERPVRLYEVVPVAAAQRA
jgi:class 3 adenylate cyclase